MRNANAYFIYFTSRICLKNLITFSFQLLSIANALFHYEIASIYFKKIVLTEIFSATLETRALMKICMDVH